MAVVGPAARETGRGGVQHVKRVGPGVECLDDPLGVELWQRQGRFGLVDRCLRQHSVIGEDCSAAAEFKHLTIGEFQLNLATRVDNDFLTGNDLSTGMQRDSLPVGSLQIGFALNADDGSVLNGGWVR